MLLLLSSTFVAVAPQRRGLPSEVLMGPLMYAAVHSVFAVVWWRTSPTGIVALACLCGGDGVAELAGRRYGRVTGPLPHNPSKVGSHHQQCYHWCHRTVEQQTRTS